MKSENIASNQTDNTNDLTLSRTGQTNSPIFMSSWWPLFSSPSRGSGGIGGAAGAAADVEDVELEIRDHKKAFKCIVICMGRRNGLQTERETTLRAMGIEGGLTEGRYCRTSPRGGASWWACESGIATWTESGFWRTWTGS